MTVIKKQRISLITANSSFIKLCFKSFQKTQKLSPKEKNLTFMIMPRKKWKLIYKNCGI
jgi:hypothetical protein